VRVNRKETLFREVIVERVRGGRGTRRVRGWLVAPVAVTGHLVVRQEDERQMTSTAIRRILVEDHDSQVVYIETQNSTYRITFVSSADEARQSARVSATVSERDRGVEVTLVEQVGIDASQSKR
jgi:hypothetical protein